MKKLLILGSVFAISVVGFQSCKKEVETNFVEANSVKVGRVNFEKSSVKTIEQIDTELTNFYSNQSQNKAAPGWWKRFVKWVEAHSGTHLFDFCSGGGSCGPCPGICLGGVMNLTTETTPIGSADLSKGRFSLMHINGNKFLMSFADLQKFTHNNVLYVPSNTNLGLNVAGAFGLTSMVIKQGVYPVSFANSALGETIVDIIY